ncbi:MAG: TonB-dependent receptor family protein [Kiritimatiellia bacterium]
MHVSRQFISFFNRALVLAFATSALTAVSAPVTTNAPIVVTASRANRTAEEMPANVTVITADAIRESGAQNVVSALETLGGVYFRRSSDNPGQAEISMRGFSQNSHGRVLVLVDGQRLNTADMANIDWLRIPVTAVDRIEVLRGGQTALYGDYAVAGVINIITHQPSDKASTTVSATVGSDNTFAGHIGHAGSVGDTRYTADLDWRKSDGWRDNSQYDNTDVRAMLSHDWTERFSTDLSAFYTDNSYGMPGWLTHADMAHEPRQTYTPFDNATAKTIGGNLACDGQIDADSRILCSLSATRREIVSDMFSSPPFFSASRFTDTFLDSYSLSPRYVRDDDLAGHRNNLLVGADLGLEKYDVRGFSDLARTIPWDNGTLERSRAGLYAQDEFWLSQQVSLTLGARGELCRYSSDVITNIVVGTSSSSARVDRQSALDAALLYRPADQVKLYARASTLYRDPFVDEMTLVDQSFSPTNGLPMNTSIKPETGRQLELGATVTVAKEWTADLSAYRLDMQDEIAWESVDIYGHGFNSNLIQTRRYGVDASLTWKRPDVGLASLIYNYVDATFPRGLNEGCQVPLVPANVLTLRGELDLPFDLTALAAFHAVSGQYTGGDDANVYAKLPGYSTFDFGLRYHPQQAPGFDLLVGVDNAFDQKYANSAIYGYCYYPAPGRTWKVTAMYRF